MNGKYLISKHAMPNSNKFRLKIQKQKQKVKKNTAGKKGYFLLEFDGLPETIPDPPQTLILFLLKNILTNYTKSIATNNSLFSFMNTTSLQLPKDEQSRTTSEKYVLSNAWVVFRSYYTSSIPQVIASQTELSSILSYFWKNNQESRELWSTYNKFYKNFRTTSPEINITFKTWLNLKYRLPKNFLIVHKKVCDKLLLLFNSSLILETSSNGNYKGFENHLVENDLVSITNSLLNKILESTNEQNAITQIIAQLDAELNLVEQ